MIHIYYPVRFITFKDAGYGEKSFFAPDEEENESDARKIDDEVNCTFLLSPFHKCWVSIFFLIFSAVAKILPQNANSYFFLCHSIC